MYAYIAGVLELSQIENDTNRITSFHLLKFLTQKTERDRRKIVCERESFVLAIPRSSSSTSRPQSTNKRSPFKLSRFWIQEINFVTALHRFPFIAMISLITCDTFSARMSYFRFLSNLLFKEAAYIPTSVWNWVVNAVRTVSPNALIRISMNSLAVAFLSNINKV